MLTTSNPKTNAKATFYPNPDGSLRLARIQHITGTPRFRPAGWEDRKKASRFVPTPEYADSAIDEADFLPPDDKTDKINLARAVRRARLLCYDLIQCNPDLNAFATFTYSPEKVKDKADYAECYSFIRAWFSNAVQRDGLRYIAVPELTKKGDVHFHAICNADGLRLTPALNPNSGAPIRHNGKPVYNIKNWRAGFSTAQIIEAREATADSREAVARYIFKYMTKNAGAKIGGRYALKGGALAVPLYDYDDSPETWLDGAVPDNIFQKELITGETYTCYDFGNPKRI